MFTKWTQGGAKVRGRQRPLPWPAVWFPSRGHSLWWSEETEPSVLPTREGLGRSSPKASGLPPGNSSLVWVQPTGVSNLLLDPGASRALHKTEGEIVGRGRKKFRENNVTEQFSISSKWKNRQGKRGSSKQRPTQLNIKKDPLGPPPSLRPCRG